MGMLSLVNGIPPSVLAWSLLYSVVSWYKSASLMSLGLTPIRLAGTIVCYCTGIMWVWTCCSGMVCICSWVCMWLSGITWTCACSCIIGPVPSSYVNSVIIITLDVFSLIGRLTYVLLLIHCCHVSRYNVYSLTGMSMGMSHCFHRHLLESWFTYNLFLYVLATNPIYL